jgi:hypothetical protein
MNNESNTSRYQIVSSMSVDELLSEGYGNYDDLYDPEEEKDKEEIARGQEETRKNTKSEEYYKEHYIEF